MEDEKKTERIFCRVKPNFKERLERVAKYEGRNTSQLIETVVESYIERMEKIMEEKKGMDRNEAFGRILAILENAEMKIASKSATLGNAIPLYFKYTQNGYYSNHPFTAFKSYHDNLTQAYVDKGISPEDWQDKIMDVVSQAETLDNQELTEFHLIGYYKQRKELEK